MNSRIRKDIIVPDGVTCLTYGSEPESDFHAFNIEHQNDYYSFSSDEPRRKQLEDLHFTYPGIINIENITAASAIALIMRSNRERTEKRGCTVSGCEAKIRYTVLNIPGLAYVDDYAHHPEEIKACIRSVKEFFKGRKITGIFQPHLYSQDTGPCGGICPDP